MPTHSQSLLNDNGNEGALIFPFPGPPCFPSAVTCGHASRRQLAVSVSHQVGLPGRQGKSFHSASHLPPSSSNTVREAEGEV